MADVKMPDSVLCQFDAKGWSPCKRPSTNGLCSEHEGLKCVVCDQQAHTKCDQAMGGLTCGAPLCLTCEHDPVNGGHVTQEVARARRQAEKEEREAKAASRTSPDQRLDEETGLPLNLFELLKGDWEAEGFVLAHVYYLKLDDSPWGTRPAIFESDHQRIVFVTDLHLLFKVLHFLKPKPFNVMQVTAYVCKAKAVAYLEQVDAGISHEDSRPEPLLTQEEYDQLAASDECGWFRWPLGVFGMREHSEQHQRDSFVRQAQKYDPGFASASA
ncbi:MAG: hypothetical protein V1695_00400 [Candidatus Uhrbacteria bacterium]